MEEIKVSEMLQADSIEKDNAVMIIQDGVNKKASGSIQTATGTSLSLTSVADTCKVTSNSKNIFDGQLEQGMYDPSTGNKTSGNNFYRSTNKIAVEPNTTYTISINGTARRYVVLFYQVNGTFISSTGYDNGVFTTASNCYYIAFRNYEADYTADYANLKIQIEEGSTATEYNPYNTEVGIFGKNVFDQNQIKNPPVDGNGRKIQLTLKPNTQYTMSTSCPTSTQGSTLIFFAAGTSIDGLSTWTNGVWNGQTRTFTSDANGNMVVAYRRQTGDDNINLTDYWYQIEEGSTATTYEKFEGQYLDLIPDETKSAFTYDSLTNVMSDGNITIEYNTQSRLLNNDDVLDIVEPVKEYVDREIYSRNEKYRYSTNGYNSSEQTIGNTLTKVGITPTDLQVKTHGGDLLITFTCGAKLTQAYTGSAVVDLDGTQTRIHTYWGTTFNQYSGQVLLKGISAGTHTLNIKAHSDSSQYNLVIQSVVTQSLSVIEL